MTVRSTGHRALKIRRTGRHTTPSPVEKVAAQAGKAAPAVAIAGALVAVPTAQQASAATASKADPAGAASAAHSVRPAARASANRTYTVRGGDTLSLIAQRFYHKPADWQWLYHVNAKTIPNPDVIYAGQRISVPVDPPAHFTLTGYQPKHAKPATSTASGTSATSHGSGSRSGSTSTGGHRRSGGSRSAHGSSDWSGTGTTTDNAGSSGVYSCSALESLWQSAGGSPSAALIAADIAMAESGGNPDALSPTNDYGLWQINGSNGSLATFNPYQNARSAIILSNNGANWAAWTTYASGAFQGRC
jgi:LysM repeat protein